MKYLQEFNRIMTEQGQIALATSVNKIPNVRIVNFYYDTKKKGILFFSTFMNNPKTKEFSQNNCVAFTTIPEANEEHVRVTDATVNKSNFTIYDLQDEFVKKIPDYEMTIAQAGKQLDLYEIHFKNASVTLDMTQIGKVSL